MASAPSSSTTPRSIPTFQELLEPKMMPPDVDDEEDDGDVDDDDVDDENEDEEEEGGEEENEPKKKKDAALMKKDDFDDESFENHRSGLIAEKLEKDPSLSYETGHYWTQITDKRCLFDISKLVAEEPQTVLKADVVKWYNTYLRPPPPKCCQLAVHAWGCNTNMQEGAPQKGKVRRSNS